MTEPMAVVSFNEEPRNTWWVKQGNPKRKFYNVCEIFDSGGEGGTFYHEITRNTKTRRKRRMLVGGRR